MYVVMQRGMPVFVSGIFTLAKQTADEMSVTGAPASVVPVTPIPEQLELDFSSEPPTNPQ